MHKSGEASQECGSNFVAEMAGSSPAGTGSGVLGIFSQFGRCIDRRAWRDQSCRMSSLWNQVVGGFVAGALSVLTFHQAMIGVLHATGVIGFAPFPMGPVGPLHVPQLVDLCFWGGVWGVLFAFVSPGAPGSPLVQGIVLGIAAVLAAHLIVAPLKGGSIYQGWEPRRLAISLAINCFWGIGVALILPSLQGSRSLRRV